MHRSDNHLVATADMPFTSITYDRFRRNKLALSGPPSQSFGSRDGLTLSSGIDGRYVIDPANCDGHWITAGKRQFERLVEKHVNPLEFLSFRGGA